MRYTMKPKLWSWAETFTILDGDGTPFARVESKPLSFGPSMKLLGLDGDLLASIDGAFLSSTYQINLADGRLATVKKPFSLLRRKLEIYVDGLELVANGSFWSQDYTIERDGLPIATISKTSLWRDTYDIDVFEGEDPVLLIALAAVIECSASDDS
jgi:uncharacterized protein YxjI